MKKFILFAMMLMALPCYSQKLLSGSFTLPAQEKYLIVDWDFSKTIFEKKYAEKEWIAMHGQKEWEEATSEALTLILKKMNDKMERTRIIAIKKGSDLKAAYTLFISPISLDRKGNNKSLYILKMNSTGEEIGKCQLKGDGGHWGSLANLLGDGYEEAAGKMGKFIVKHNKMKK